MRHLVVMLKEPRVGAVKTRLGQDIGMVNAAWWFRHQTSGLLRRLLDPRWKIWIAVSPDKQGLESKVWPAHLPRIPQRSGDLGERMARIFQTMPTGPVCIIGGDVPDIRPHHIQRAFGALGPSDAVFGPATDGGVWLIGMKRTTGLSSTILQNVRWSSKHALTDSVASLSPMRIAYVDQLQDVDTSADLKKFSK